METRHDSLATLYRIKFIFLLTFQIFGIAISLLIFWFFLTHRALLRDIRHQAILLLLGNNFIQLTCDLPMPIYFYYIGHVNPATSAYCTWWTFFEYMLDVITALLVVVITIQRHILIFHDSIFRKRITRWLLYYVPLLLCFVYPFILYMVLIVFYPCDGLQWDYSSNVCGFANCHLVYSKTLSTFDWAAHNGMPTLIIILGNVSLIIRVIKQKRRHQQHITWRKQRRITLQLLAVSMLFLVAWLPGLVIALIQQTIDPNFAIDFQRNYALDLVYFMCIFLPWICIGQLPRFVQWIGKRICRKRNATINIVRPM
ncbi:hypothetical protein I4U23_019986 [Adineta vaga]|nr:hypothetical protein I4U23_019986 [Adineta vaga]